MNQCYADSPFAALFILGIPLLMAAVGWVFWMGYGKDHCLPRLLTWRAAVRARVSGFFQKECA